MSYTFVERCFISAVSEKGDCTGKLQSCLKRVKGFVLNKESTGSQFTMGLRSSQQAYARDVSLILTSNEREIDTIHSSHIYIFDLG